MIDRVYTQVIGCCNIVNDSFVRSMNNLVNSFCHLKTNQDTLT